MSDIPTGFDGDETTKPRPSEQCDLEKNATACGGCTSISAAPTS
jgi:hypothetical protein